MTVEWGEDFGGDEETVLANHFEKPVMVSNYPIETKAFYMEPDPEEPGTALALDVLAPEGYGEIIGGSQRIHDHDLLLQRIEEHDLPREAFQWYLDVRRYGTFPPQRLRHGHRALRRLGHGPEAPAGDDPLSADVLYRLYP